MGQERRGKRRRRCGSLFSQREGDSPPLLSLTPTLTPAGFARGCRESTPPAVTCSFSLPPLPLSLPLSWPSYIDPYPKFRGFTGFNPKPFLNNKNVRADFQRPFLGAPQSILRMSISPGSWALAPMILTLPLRPPPLLLTNDLSYSTAQISVGSPHPEGRPSVSLSMLSSHRPSKARQTSWSPQSVSFLRSYVIDSPTQHPPSSHFQKPEFSPRLLSTFSSADLPPVYF